MHYQDGALEIRRARQTDRRAALEAGSILMCLPELAGTRGWEGLGTLGPSPYSRPHPGVAFGAQCQLDGHLYLLLSPPRPLVTWWRGQLCFGKPRRCPSSPTPNLVKIPEMKPRINVFEPGLSKGLWQQGSWERSYQEVAVREAFFDIIQAICCLDTILSYSGENLSLLSSKELFLFQTSFAPTALTSQSHLP